MFGYWRNRFGEWITLGGYKTQEFAQEALLIELAHAYPKITFEWVGVTCVSDEPTRPVYAVLSITELDEKTLNENYPPSGKKPVEVPEGKQRYFLEQLDDRQRKELAFAEIYVAQFGHGTDGHNRLLLIAKLAALLDATETELDSEKKPK